MSKIKVYNNVSFSHLSIARHYGGLRVDGQTFKYDYSNDALVNEKDVKQYCIEIKEVEGSKEPRWEI